MVISLSPPRPNPAAAEPRVPVSAEPPGVNNLVTLAVSVVVVGALYFARDVLIPVTLAVLLSFLLTPLANLLRRLRLGRVPAVLLAVFLALSVIVAVSTVIGLQIASLSDDFPRYETAMNAKIETLRGFGSGILNRVQKQLVGKLEPPPVHSLHDVPHVPSGTAQSPVTVQVKEAAPTPLGIARQVLGPLLGPLGTTALVLVIAVFILLQEDDLRDRMIRLFGSGDLHRTTLAMNDAARRLSKYFLTQLAINTFFGLLIAAGLSLLHVPSAALWGLIGTLLRFVPYVGAYVAAVPPVLLAAAVAPGWAGAVSTLALFLGTELVIGQAVEPYAYGHSTGLSPISVVVATIFWAWIWGPVGLVLATPLTLCLVVLGRHVKRLEFLDVLLGDRPALTPVDSLYQRMLANDPEEAATQADVLLRQRSLSAYYDEVALKALMLAAHDVERGVLTRERQLVMRDAMCGLVDDLDEYDDIAPDPPGSEEGPLAPSEAEQAIPRTPPLARQAPPATSLPDAWQGANPVLCIGGRGPLDDAAASMLAQLLTKHGLNARAERHEAVARPVIGNLDVTGVGAICISYMEETGSPAHLRFLLRRLRQRAPHAHLVVALWAMEGAPAWEKLGADSHATTLRQALAACLDAADAAARTADHAGSLVAQG
jgi:predicted PurR-regulated permease PerM